MGKRDKPSRRMKFETQFHVWFDYYTVAIYPAVNCTRLIAWVDDQFVSEIPLQ